MSLDVRYTAFARLVHTLGLVAVVPSGGGGGFAGTPNPREFVLHRPKAKLLTCRRDVDT